MKITVKIYSCYERTYKRIYRKILHYIYGDFFDASDVILEIVDLSNEGKRGIQSQRSLSDYVTRAIYIYEDNNFAHLVGISNTNLDYDKKHEKELNPSLKYLFNDPTRPYHGNAYFKQGTPKLFNYYFEQKKIWPNLNLSFYLLDVNLGIPSNMFNCLTWRELQTIGFSVLNIDEIDFSQYERAANTKITDKHHIAYSSFTKYINDISEISRRNRGNKPSFLQTYEHCVINDKNDEVYFIDKYIYTFKALSAQGYDALFRVLCLKVLADREGTEIEFRLGKQYFAYTEAEKKISDSLTEPIIQTFCNFGTSIKFVTNEEFMDEKNLKENAYLRAKRDNNPRNQLLFRNNLRKKGLPIRCVICGNDDQSLLKAAHIWEVTDIKNASKKDIEDFISNNGLESLIDSTSTHANEVFFKKYCLTNSGDNGIWLCGTHHDMFDKNYFCFEGENGEVHILRFSSTKQQEEFIKSLRSGTSTCISKADMTTATKAFLTMRNLPFGI